jgi:hypothetical protein
VGEQSTVEKKMGQEETKSAKSKLEILDKELGDAIAMGRIKLPKHALTTPVKKVMKEEEERVSKAESNFQEEYRVNLCEALRIGQIDCIGCLTGVGCEWDGPMGELILAHGRQIRLRYASMTNNMIRYQLYRFYVFYTIWKGAQENERGKKRRTYSTSLLCRTWHQEGIFWR